jgi:hypothetical protein
MSAWRHSADPPWMTLLQMMNAMGLIPASSPARTFLEISLHPYHPHWPLWLAANTASRVIHEGPARIAESQTLRIVSHSCLLGFFAAGYALVLTLDNQVFLGTRYEATGLVIEFRGTASEVPVVDYKCRSRNV